MGAEYVLSGAQLAVPAMIEYMGVVYRVEWVEGLTKDDGSPLDGDYDPQNMTVHINTRVQGQYILFVLWHELTHLVLEHTGLMLADLVEERLADAFGHGVPGLLLSNPRLGALLSGAA